MDMKLIGDFKLMVEKHEVSFHYVCSVRDFTLVSGSVVNRIKTLSAPNI